MKLKECLLSNKEMSKLCTFGLHGEKIHILHVEAIAKKQLNSKELKTYIEAEKKEADEEGWDRAMEWCLTRNSYL